MFKRVILLFLGLIGYMASIWAQAEQVSANTQLFSKKEIIEVKLHTNLAALLKDRADQRDYHPAKLIYTDEDGNEVTMDAVKLRLRGHFRRKRSTCDFPPIKINFATKKTKGTIFEGQDKLKLVTHCQNNSKLFEQYVLQEHLIYQMYNCINEHSFLTRLIHITYIDSSEKYDPISKYAFLIEDEDLMAERLEGTMIETPGLAPMHLDQEVASRLAIFQYMIGNTDFSIPYMHNIKLLQKRGGGLPIPIPYDFDWSGLIYIPYTQPHEMFKTENVKQRVFRGGCREPAEFEADIAYFQSKKSEIMELLEQDPRLNKKRKNKSRTYLERFFKILDSPRLLKVNIYDECRE